MFSNLSGFTKSRLSAFGAPRLPLRTCDNVDYDATVIFSARRACAVRQTIAPALTFHGMNARERMVAPTLRGFRSVPAHSYNHNRAIIQKFQRRANFRL